MASDQSFDDEEVATAVGLHVLGEVTIAEGAERLGIEPREFREILVEADVVPQHGPETREDVEEEIDVARRVGVEPEDDPDRVLERMDRLVADTASEWGETTPIDDDADPIARNHRDAVRRTGSSKTDPLR